MNDVTESQSERTDLPPGILLTAQDQCRQLRQITHAAVRTARYGLSRTRPQMPGLLKCRTRALRNTGRIELCGSAVIAPMARQYNGPAVGPLPYLTDRLLALYRGGACSLG